MSSLASPTLESILEKHWGYPSLRAGQQALMLKALSGKDVLGILPTNAGKSLVFQIPVLCQKGLGIVFSPLLSLMHAQVEELKRRDIGAAYLHHELSAKAQIQLLEACRYGKLSFLYLAPERLRSRQLVSWLKTLRIDFWIVDEAHCVLAWKDDFRPSYRLLGPMRQEICPHTPIIALSASVRSAAVPELRQALGLRPPPHFFCRKESSRRENLVYASLYAKHLMSKLVDVLAKVKGTALVCVGRQDEAEQVARYLTHRGGTAAAYHGGLNHATRQQRQQAWMREELRVLVGTSAISMGLHQAQVRLVLHLYLPESVESYYQASGRAGRDQKKAYALLLYNEQTLKDARDFLTQQHPSLDLIGRVYESLYNFYALGLNQGEHFSDSFVYEDFVGKYRLPKFQTRYALRCLEEGGYVSLVRANETSRQPARIRLLMDAVSLHKTEAAHSALRFLTQGLRRYVGGKIFDEKSDVDLKNLSQRLDMPCKELCAQLQRLHNCGIVDYEPAQSLPQIRFLQSRIHRTDVNISARELKKKYEAAQHRLKEMMDYAKNTTQCRQTWLSERLDSQKGEACGSCDVCLARVNKGSYGSVHETSAS